MRSSGNGAKMSRPAGTSPPMKRHLLLAVGLLVFALVLSSESWAHRSGCHRWHSCPSDRGTYTCGDLGHCSGCPNNQYCLAGQPRPASAEERGPNDLKRHDLGPNFHERLHVGDSAVAIDLKVRHVALRAADLAASLSREASQSSSCPNDE